MRLLWNSRRTPKLSGLLGCHRRWQVGLFDLDVTSKLIGLEITDEVVAERDDGLDAMSKLDVVQMMEKVAHLQLSSLGHFHVKQSLLVLVLSLCNSFLHSSFSLTPQKNENTRLHNLIPYLFQTLGPKSRDGS